ncbi:MAG: RNA polymerase factor sigma-32 [Aquisalinus sp.]|nr:RNA polymerase factor sigma-32 [Aquisalinus sp.]
MDYNSFNRENARTAFEHKILTAEEEQLCAERWLEKGDKRALDKLILAHQRMAVAAAMKFKNYGLPIDDLIQEGVIGLLEAAKRFDPAKGFRFSTYAGWWIKASIQDYVLRNWSMVRVGTTNAHKSIFFNLGRIRKMIEQADRGEMTKTDVAHKFKVTVEDLDVATSRLSARDSSLNVILKDDSTTEKQDMLEDDRETPDVAVMRAIDEEKLQDRISLELNKLSEREQAVIQHRFFDETRMTLAGIGEKLNLSKERIRQIEKAALAKLQQGFATDGELYAH